MKLKSNSMFLKATDLKDGDKITFMDEGKYEMSPFKDKNGNPKEVMKIGIKLPNGEVKQANVNGASQKWLGENLTDETSAWVGKEVPVFVLPQNIAGKWHKVVYFGALPSDEPRADGDEEEINPADIPF